MLHFVSGRSIQGFQGMTTRKALHAADARFARHAALAALPLVASGGWLRTRFPPKRSLDGAPDWAEDDKKGQKQIPCGNDNQEELRQKKKRILCGNDNRNGRDNNGNGYAGARAGI